MINKIGYLYLTRVIFSAYSILILYISMKYLNLDEYGSIVKEMSIYALFGRVITWGFGYKIRDLIDESSSGVKTYVASRQLLYILSLLLFLIVNLIYEISSNPLLILLALFLYTFDISLYYQAINQQLKIFFVSLFGCLLSGIVLIYIISNGGINHKNLLLVIMVVPNLFWALMCFYEVMKDKEVLNLNRVRYFIFDSWEMFTITSLSGLYTNLIPIMLGSISLSMAGLYGLVSRLSNFSKMFGFVFNQVIYYGRYRVSLVRKVVIPLLSGIVGSALSGLFFNVYFTEKVGFYFDSEWLFIAFVMIFTIVGVIANSLIITVFYDKKLYKEYRLRSFIIICSVMAAAYYNLFGLNLILAHLLIEILIIVTSIHFLKKGKINEAR